jgi:hypothetical protein
LNHVTGIVREYSIEEHHAYHADLALPPHCPDELKTSWVEAMHLGIYGFYCRTFLALCDQQCLISLELALRLRLGLARSGGLRNVLVKADEAGLVDRDSLLPENRMPKHRIVGDGTPHSAASLWTLLLDALPSLRNDYAHGTGSRWSFGGTIPELAHSLITNAYLSAAAERR